MKIGRNDKCPCGSGKKFKYCCTGKTENELAYITQKNWFDTVSSLPLRAEISSQDGKESEMKVFSAKIYEDGYLVNNFSDEITLKVNQTPGDYSAPSKAIFTLPRDEQDEPKINLSGNATVSNLLKQQDIQLKDNAKELKVKSKTGLFALLRAPLRRDEGFKCFDIIFGEVQRKEINEIGRKDRPHITIYPDGNGKYIRLNSYRCDIEQELGYDKINKIIFPKFCNIVLEQYSEKLQLNFSYNEKSIVLTEAKFIT